MRLCVGLSLQACTGVAVPVDDVDAAGQLPRGPAAVALYMMISMNGSGVPQITSVVLPHIPILRVNPWVCDPVLWGSRLGMVQGYLNRLCSCTTLRHG